MKSVDSQPSVLDGAAGYWTIQLVLHAGAKVGHQHVCHAENLTQAKAIASHLCGDTRASAGFDLYRVGWPTASSAPELALGQSRPINDPAAWAALASARIG